MRAHLLGLSGLIATGLFPAVAAAAMTAINIDFDGRRDPDAATAPTFVGVGAFGTTGTVFNSMPVDSGAGGALDNQSPVATNLLDEFGVATTVGFTVGPIGGDINGAGDLIGDYFFNNSAGNGVGLAGSPFTFSGLSAASVDIFFYTSVNGPSQNVVTINGSTGTMTTLNGFGGRLFTGIPVVAGSVSGTFADLTNGSIETAVIAGVSIVPEPSGATLSLLGLTGLAGWRRHRSRQ